MHYHSEFADTLCGMAYCCYSVLAARVVLFSCCAQHLACLDCPTCSVPLPLPVYRVLPHTALYCLPHMYCQPSLPVLPPVNASVLPTPSGERPLGGSSSYSQLQQAIQLPAVVSPAAAAAGGLDPSLLRSPSGAHHLALNNLAAGISSQVPASPLPQHKLHMPNSADKMADTGKVGACAYIVCAYVCWEATAVYQGQDVWCVCLA